MLGSMIEMGFPGIVTVSEMLFGFIHKKRTVDVEFLLRSLQQVYCAKGKKLYMCFVDPKKAFDRVAR